MIKEKPIIVQTPIWRKIKGKWVNLVEFSKTKTYTSEEASQQKIKPRETRCCANAHLAKLPALPNQITIHF